MNDVSNEIYWKIYINKIKYQIKDCFLVTDLYFQNDINDIKISIR